MNRDRKKYESDLTKDIDRISSPEQQKNDKSCWELSDADVFYIHWVHAGPTIIFVLFAGHNSVKYR